MDEPLSEIARKLRRDARRNAHTHEPGERRLDGWRLTLSLARHDDFKAIAIAQDVARAAFGNDFVSQRFSDSPDGPVDRWHLMVAWQRTTAPTAAHRERVVAFILALNIPEAYREARVHDAVMYPGGDVDPGSSHWMWPEAVQTKNS
jgi:hypothetical protein